MKDLDFAFFFCCMASCILLSFFIISLFFIISPVDGAMALSFMKYSQLVSFASFTKSCH